MKSCGEQAIPIEGRVCASMKATGKSCVTADEYVEMRGGLISAHIFNMTMAQVFCCCDVNLCNESILETFLSQSPTAISENVTTSTTNAVSERFDASLSLLSATLTVLSLSVSISL